MPRKVDKKAERQRGSVTVEAVIAFTGFLAVIFTILGLVNFCRAQMLISSAVDTAAKELSQYAYFYKMSGLQKFSMDVSSQASVGKTNINQIIGTVDTLYSTLGGAVDHTVSEATNLAEVTQKGELELQDFETVITNIQTDGTNVVNSISSMTQAMERVGSDPLLYMRSLVAIAGEEGLDLVKSHVIAAPLSKLFVQKHFGSSHDEANKALIALGVENGIDGMNFNMSTVFSSSAPEDIEIVVYYKLKIFQILNWDVLEANLCKRAVCRAWLGGDDVQAIVDVTQDEPFEEDTQATEPAEGTDPTEETVPETTEPEEEPVDLEGSYWYLGIDGHGYDEKAAAFDNLLVDSKGITRETLVFEGLLYGRDQNNVAYGMAYCATAEDAEHIALMAFCHSMEQIKVMEDAYRDSDGAKGYEPGSTTSYTYVVYVPENIPDSELAAIQKKAKEMADRYRAYAIEQYGIDIPVSLEFVKAGGNYDYGSGGKS